MFYVNCLTAIGPYMTHRFFRASFKVNNFSNFFRRLPLIAQNVAELFNSNSGVSVRVRFSRIDDMSRGPA